MQSPHPIINIKHVYIHHQQSTFSITIKLSSKDNTLKESRHYIEFNQN